LTPRSGSRLSLQSTAPRQRRSRLIRVTSHVGQKIQSGDTLLVLEAMKMETNITAPAAGKIAKVNVAQGDAVQGGMVLVEFE
jgi:methylmalonyl-CoA carboxyltransferase small subunit